MKFPSRYVTASLMRASAERIVKGKCLPTIDEEGEDLSSDDDVNGETVAKGEDLSSDDEGMSRDDGVKGEVKDTNDAASGSADVIKTTSDLMVRAASGCLMFDDGRGQVPPNHVVLGWSSHTFGLVRVSEPLAVLAYAEKYTRTQGRRPTFHRRNWGPY